MKFFVHDHEGTIVSSGECHESVLGLYSFNGLTARIGDASPLRHYYDVANNRIVAFSPQVAAQRSVPPPRGYRWIRDTLVDERTLDQARKQKWTEIKRARDAAEEADFTIGGYTFDADRRSQAAIAAAVQDMTLQGGPASVSWTLADDTTITVTANQMKAVLRGIRAHVQTQRDKAAVLRDAILAATTVAEVDALSW